MDSVVPDKTPGRCTGYSFDTLPTTTSSTALERERVGAGRDAIRTHCSALRVRILEHLENSIASASIYKSSYKGLTVDALASGADEGRVWLRKASGSCRESYDPEMSEWGNPAGVMPSHPCLNT